MNPLLPANDPRDARPNDGKPQGKDRQSEGHRAAEPRGPTEPSAAPAAPSAEGRPPGYGYGYGYGQLLRPNRFVETSELFARLHRYEVILRKHWWVLLLALAVTVGPVSYYTYKTPPSYRSQAKMWLSGKLDVNIREGGRYTEEQALTIFIATQVELLKSSTVYERALTNLLKKNPALESVLFSTNQPDRPPFVVEVRESPKTAVIGLKATGKEGQSTRQFLDAIMEEYATFRREVRAQSSGTTLNSITEQVKETGKKVKDEQERLHAFTASNNVVMVQEQGSSAGAYVARLSKQLANLKTEYQLLELLTPDQLTQATTKTRPQNPEEAPIGEDSARELLMSLSGPQADFFKASQQIQLYKAKRQELSEFLRPTHPKIIKLDEDIASQQQIVEVFRDQSLTQMQNRRQALKLQIENLETSAKEWEAKALDASKKMADYERIRADVKRHQDLYDRLLTVIQSVDVNRTLDQETVRVMEPASVAKPVRQTAKLLALGLVGGLCVGFGALYLIGLFDDRFSSISELRAHFAEVVIGQVPELPAGEQQILELVSPNDTRHVFAESFRNIRSSLLYMVSEKERPKTILITSSVPSEGKSTMAANLAATLALSGSKVLLVDGDLRRAKQHQIFGAEQSPGLAEVLQQEAHYTDAIIRTKTPNLFFLPAGEPRTNPGELFLAPSAEVFLVKIRAHYDFIIFDSAPVLATDDTTSLSPQLDGVIFVVRGDFTSARMAREALHLLRQRQVNVLGLIFNRAIPTRGESYHYYKYHDYYYSKRVGKGGQPGQQPVAPSPEETVQPG